VDGKNKLFHMLMIHSRSEVIKLVCVCVCVCVLVLAT